MNWLISLVIAGVMFSNEGTLPVATNYTESNTKTVVKMDETERFEQTYPLSANGRVSVSNVNGSISVETWDRNEVKLEAIKTAGTREDLADVDIRINAQPDSLQVEADFDSLRRRNNGQNRNHNRLEVQFHLTVPRNAVLDEIETVNGSINITNAGNSTKASAVNGEVRATNLRGTANLSTVNGTVNADFDQLKAGSKISLDTVNGQVNLVIPSDANATVKADTLNGSITTDFGLSVRKGQYVGKDLYGRIGTGDVKIKLNSVNGGLSVKRKNDGKNMNPATNLLPQKNTDDEDVDPNDNSFNSKKMNKEIEKSIARSNKDIAKSLKEAQKEIAKIQPELAKINVEALKQAEAQINSKEFREKLKEAQKLAIAQMSEANWLNGSPSVEKKSGSFAVNGTPKITVDAKNCSVAVRGWDKPEVSYSVVKISESHNNSTLNINAVGNVSDVSIKVTNIDNTVNRENFPVNTSRVRVEIYVPKKSDLKITGDGEIRLEGVTGTIDLQGADESVNVRDVDGKLSVRTSDGLIRVIGFRGAFDGKTDEGMMNLEGDFQPLSARTVNGTIVLTLPENANANIESNRKDIISEGISLVYLGDGKSTSTWKVGNGGENHLLYTSADGKVFVRGINTLKNN